jgi:hypothetical protein
MTEKHTVNAELLANPTPDTLLGAEILASDLFAMICKYHGELHARRIFAETAKGITKADILRMNKFTILERYDAMTPAPNVGRLARELEEEGKRLPPERQITPRPGASRDTIERYIFALLAERKEAIANGTWHGPPFEWGRIIVEGDENLK